MATIATSYIQTNGGTTTRTRDTVSWTLAARPQAMTLYIRFLELGLLADGTAGSDLVMLSTTDGRFGIERSSGGVYIARHRNRFGTEVTSTAGAAATYGDLVELLVTLSATGVVQLTQALNGAPGTAATASSAQALETAFGNTTLRLTPLPGAVAVTDLLLHRGTKTLATMRRLAGVR